jgi:4,5:9,10-diseco-3-hydroxy-5,9,17-trioxoandrosta-1(10),2-diene-4-oate hydrolase
MLRRFLVALGAAVLLWVGLGEPHPTRPVHQATWIETDSLRLRVLEAGRGDTTLLLLHGYGESLLAWRLLLDRFTRHYRVVTLDLPGFGLSDKPDAGYDYPAYARWLGDFLLQQTRGPVVVVGHSMGGQIAAGLALDHPDRVVAAVLIDPAGAGINTLLTDTGGIASPATKWVVSAISYVLPVHDSAWLAEPPDAREYEPSSDSNSARSARRVLEQFDFAALKGRFGDLKQPVLLIWGEQDPTIPFSIGQQVAERLPCRRFVPLVTLHRPHQSVPDTVAAEMEAFLRHPECGAR